MNHEHPPTPEIRDEVLTAIQELAEEQKIHNETPDPKDADRIEKIKELRKFLEERGVNPDNVEVKPELHAEGAHATHDEHESHGHGEEAKKGLFKTIVGGISGGGIVGGGIFIGIISSWANYLLNTIRGKDGGGGGHKSGGGGGHGGGGHH